MKTIEITTTQNVTLEYQLAGVWERVFAWFLDFLIIIIGKTIVMALINAVFGHAEWLSYLFDYPILLFYHLVFEMTTRGQSPGKMALNIRVVKLNGSNPEPNAFIMRWIFRPVDLLFSLGAIAVILVSSTRRSQRIGDTLANTVVIKEPKQQMLNLKEILSIQTQDNYEIHYPQVRQFTEQDMLLIKNTLDRHKKYPNKAHRQALISVAEKLQQQLGIAKIKGSKSQFLRTILRDYIVLTR